MTPGSKSPRLWESRGNGLSPQAECPDPPATSSKQPKDQMTDRMFDKAGLAAYLHMSYRTLDRCAGVLPPADLTIGSRSPRWLPSTIERWLRTKPRLPGR
jgi:hypothetical protein